MLARLDEHNQVHLIIHHVQDVTMTVLGEVGSMNDRNKELQANRLQVLAASRLFLGPTRRLIEETQDLISSSRKRTLKRMTRD
jgi:hypothetical protein